MYSGVSQRGKGVGGVLAQVSCVQWCQSERQGSGRCTSSGQSEKQPQGSRLSPPLSHCLRVTLYNN